MLTNVFTGLAVGVNVYIARLIGENNREKIVDAVHTSIDFGIVGGILSAIIGIAVARPILTITSCPKEIIDYAVLYLRIYFIGMPAVLVYNYGAGVCVFR